MKVRYSRLWSLGNYENEKVELERDFPDDTPFSEALAQLMKEVEEDYKVRMKIREAIQEVAEW